MFNRKTVFVLGAGASWHYGYPTGEALVRKAILAAEHFAEFFGGAAERWLGETYPKFVSSAPPIDNPQAPWLAAKTKCESLAWRLKQVNPLVIDYFLGHNPSLQDVGKLIICWVILDSEDRYFQRHANPNRREVLEASPLKHERDSAIGLDVGLFKDGWCRFVLHKLITGCSQSSDILKNNVTFVTFNYDVSLEYAMYHGLNAIDTFREEDVTAFLEDPRIIHCYGKVRGSIDPPQRANPFTTFFDQRRTPGAKIPQDIGRRVLLDDVFDASKRLSTIDPSDKSANTDLMGIASKAIREAEVVYILGYGFDESNSERICLNGLGFSEIPKNIMFTNFGDINRVNKKAGRSLGRDFMAFIPPRHPLLLNSAAGYIEKSTRNVYDALELDFDELEDMP